jgi:hypothetical protein
MRWLLASGMGLTALVTLILWWVWGRGAVVPGITFGLLATVIQLAAVAVLRPATSQPFGRLMARWGMGMGFRFVGVLLFALAVVLDRQLFPPLPTAFGYLGVLVPLLYTETRFLR